MHYAFAIHQENTRATILKILLDNEVGDQDKQNHQGLEPVQIGHDQPIPRAFFDNGGLNMEENFKGQWQMSLEGDYLIVCPVAKLRLVTE